MNMKKTDQCDEFTQFKSSIVCQSHGCTQTGKTYITQGSFGKTIIPIPVTLTLNCSLIEPSYYFGCALIEKISQDVQLNVKNKHSYYQNISQLCIANGTSHTNALKDFGQTKQYETEESIQVG
ncbi:unnamed protein product [Paramecium pentaurelia]|uniref:Uncharacterized protein n=1 Tax=Paramecium pentaurelia TaxID=43138 RepID=A0A8S1X201_9CILI|nr:unnamed protein product [Paramecium pentaurelia]